MKKLFVLLLILSPLFSIAQEFSSREPSEEELLEPPAAYADVCSGFSDPACYGRAVGSFCFKRFFGQERTGHCYVAGFGPHQRAFICRCL